MSIDKRGLALTGSGEASAAYDRAVDHLVRFQAEAVEQGAKAVDADPSCAMGVVLNTYVSLMSTEENGVEAARDAMGALSVDLADLVPRERAHLVAARRWVEGDMVGAGDLLDEISIEYPRDLLALIVGHQIDFFTGNASNLRDRIGRALHAWSHDDEQFGFVEGMYAFGLEECNLYGLSEEVGRRAVAANVDDVWGLHAVVHTFEMEGRIPEGVRFMRARASHWGTKNFLNVHNSWHFALYLLEGDDVPGALAVYDGTLHHDESEDVAFELLDATSLLWRLHLEAVPVGERWRALADAWARSLSPGYYPFNDMHATMAFVGAGDGARARDLVATLEQFVEKADRATTAWVMTAAVGLPICRSLVLFGEGDYASVLDELLPIRTKVHEFGGSHAQRDVVERSVLEAAIRCGRIDLASGLVSERLSVRERSSYSWSKRAEILASLSDRDGADRAMARARSLTAAIEAVGGSDRDCD